MTDVSHGHRLHVVDRHRMDFRDVDDLNLGDDHLMDVNLCLHMNDRLGGHLKDDDRHDALVGHHKNGMDDRNDQNLDGNRVNRNCVLRDQNLGAMTGVNHDRHTSDRLDDHSMDDGLMKGGNLYRRMNVMDDRNDLMMVVNLLNRNCALRDLKTGASLGVNRGHRMSDRLDDQNDLKMGGTTDVSRVIRMSDRLDDQNLGVSRVIRNCVRRDLMTDGNLDVNRDHHMNVMDDRNDLMMVVNLVNRNYVRHDRKMGGNSDVNLCLRMSDLLDDHLKDDDRHDVLGDLHMNAMDDRKMDVSRANRNCVRRDQMTDVNLDAMSHRVKLTGDRSTSCDRMSHDHLRCDHLMMLHRDTNRMGVKNLDVNHPKKDDPKKDARMH